MRARPPTAPHGMIRAQMATFPPREGIFRRVVEAILPQVDGLFIVFNEYAAIPPDIAGNPKISAVVPDRDVKDAGKFWFPPGPDDIVFVIDDDVGYPADFIATSIAAADEIGWDEGAFGYCAVTWKDRKQDGNRGWSVDKFAKANRRARGVDILFTNGAMMRGDIVPSLDKIEPFAGHVDIGLAVHLRDTGRHAWLLPHDGAWISNELPDELYASSLFATHAKRPPPHVSLATRRLIEQPPANRGIPFHKYRKIDQPAFQE